MTPEQFIDKWKPGALTERATAIRIFLIYAPCLNMKIRSRRNLKSPSGKFGFMARHLPQVA